MSQICIHGHFYQPPRENPWLEEIELQDSAYPYHDWNERITEECYAANAASRILDDSGLITKIASNYASISFDFGPTLMAWLERQRPEVYRAVLDADDSSRRRFSGHGGALAQGYHHIIHPLASSRDRTTQVLWGLRDFEYRFARSAEGMWLPETAVDLESLEALADAGLRYTVLAPYQAARVRPLGKEKWTDVGPDNPLDTSVAYLQRLPSGRTIALFFYDAELSRAVAFEGLLGSGQAFAERLLKAPGRDDERALVNIATDGETYGHHHRFGDMALAYAVDAIAGSGSATLTNYSDYLDRFPPRHEVEIRENTSWSCAHGVERWRADCGCRIGSATWNQAWRAPLREALDWLRDRLAVLFEKAAGQYLRDPWEARNAYVDVTLQRSQVAVERFLDTQPDGRLTVAQRVEVLRLMEMQRHAMQMYTSCGWFFDDLGGIETVQILRYAGRALQLAESFSGDDLEDGFLQRLRAARSNLGERGNGAQIYMTMVRPAMTDLRGVGAHYAISSLFNGYAETSDVFCYRVEREDYRRSTSGRNRVVTGRCKIRSQITLESERMSFAALHLGEHNVVGGVGPALDDAHQQFLADGLLDAFENGDLARCITLLQDGLGSTAYSLRSLFRDQQREIIELILDRALSDVDAAARQLYESHAPLLRLLDDGEHPVVRALQFASAFALNSDLRRVLDLEHLDLDRAEELFRRARRWHIAVEDKVIAFELERSATALADRLLETPRDLELVATLDRLVELAQACPVEMSLWKVQNRFYTLLQQHHRKVRDGASSGDRASVEWIRRIRDLGDTLSVRVPG